MTKEISSLSPRLASIRIDVLSYSLKLVHRPGKEVVLTDVLPRACPAEMLLYKNLRTDPLLQVCNMVIKSQKRSSRYTELNEKLSVVLKRIKKG